MSDGPLAVTEPVIMEVLAGARTDDAERKLRRLLQRFDLVLFDPIAGVDGAVDIDRSCRRAGVTPRGMLDCLIGSVARRRGIDVLAHDRDFNRMAEVVGITLDEASLA